MPGKGHIPDLQERILRGLKANTNRTAGGLASNASPGMTRDRMAAMRRGAPSSGTVSARASKVDTFSIADDSDSSFTLTYAPLVDSWNLELNGVRVHGAEFSISGKTLSIVDAADLFLGADAQGSPWDLEIQYDYLTGVPVAPTGTPEVVANTFGDQNSGTWTLNLPTAPEAGSGVLLAGGAPFGVDIAPVGMGATWTLLTGGTSQCMWYGAGCDGSNGVTVHGGGAIAHATAVEVKNVTAVGVVTGGGNPDAVLGPLTAPAGGGIAFAYLAASSGIAALVTETPSPWTVLSNAGNSTRKIGVVEVGAGGTAEREFTHAGAWIMVIVAAI